MFHKLTKTNWYSRSVVVFAETGDKWINTTSFFTTLACKVLAQALDYLDTGVHVLTSISERKICRFLNLPFLYYYTFRNIGAGTFSL